MNLGRPELGVNQEKKLENHFAVCKHKTHKNQNRRESTEWKEKKQRNHLTKTKLIKQPE